MLVSARPLNVVPKRVTSVLPMSIYRYSSLALHFVANIHSAPAPMANPPLVALSSTVVPRAYPELVVLP